MTCLKHYVRVNRTEEKSFETRKTACINKGLRLKYKQLGKKQKAWNSLDFIMTDQNTKVN